MGPILSSFIETSFAGPGEYSEPRRTISLLYTPLPQSWSSILSGNFPFNFFACIGSPSIHFKLPFFIVFCFLEVPKIYSPLPLPIGIETLPFFQICSQRVPDSYSLVPERMVSWIFGISFPSLFYVYQHQTYSEPTLKNILISAANLNTSLPWSCFTFRTHRC